MATGKVMMNNGRGGETEHDVEVSFEPKTRELSMRIDGRQDAITITGDTVNLIAFIRGQRALSVFEHPFKQELAKEASGIRRLAEEVLAPHGITVTKDNERMYS